MHPLAKQAAQYYSRGDAAYLHLTLNTSEFPSGQYVFSVFAWQYTGYNTYTKLITICDNEKIAVDLPYLLEDASSAESEPNGQFDWSDIEKRHIMMWRNASEKHKSDIRSIEAFKLESIANTFRNRIRSLTFDKGEAGVTVYMCEDEHYEVAVRKTDNGYEGILKLNIGGIKHIQKTVSIPSGKAQLKIKADNLFYNFYLGDTHLGCGQTKYLTSEVSGGFTGVVIGLYAVHQNTSEFENFSCTYEDNTI